MTTASQLKQTAAGMKAVCGTLRVYSLQSVDEETRQAFREAVDITAEITGDLEARIKTLEFQEPQYKGN